MTLSTAFAPMELYMIVKDGELLRRLMATHRPQAMTARQLARDLGWASHTYVNRILNGQVRSVSTDTAVKIAYLLGVPVDLIFVPKVSGESLRSAQRQAAS